MKQRAGREGKVTGSWWPPTQAHRVCGLSSDFQELLLGSSLCLTSFLQVLFQLIGLFGPVQKGGTVSYIEDDSWKKEIPLPPYPPVMEEPELILTMAPGTRQTRMVKEEGSIFT